MGERAPLFEDELLSPPTAKDMATNVIHQFHPNLPDIGVFCKSGCQLCIDKVVNHYSVNQEIKVQILRVLVLKDEKL